jgi:Rrf2 family protein
MVEYALHSLVYLIDIPEEESIGIKDLSEFQGLSETYLSKVLAKLAKAGIVSSTPGVKGGYKLAKAAEEVSFWDVIEAVEGIKPIFQCKNILKTNMMYVDKEDQLDKGNKNDQEDQEESSCACTSGNTSCTINLTMLEAEEHMREFLRKKTLAWLNKELTQTLPEHVQKGTREYFFKNKGRSKL